MSRPKIKVINPVLSNGIHYLTSDYKTRNPNRLDHNGMDMIGKGYTADYIICIEDGTVQKVGYNSVSGYYVHVKHQDYLSIYCHMKKGSVKVKEKEQVQKGSILGYMGSTGNATGAHLHFGLKYKNAYVDPLPYLLGDKVLINESKTKYVFNCKELNVRKGPGTKYKILNTLIAGTKVEVLKQKGNWYQISDNSYVYSAYLSLNLPKKVYESKKVKATALNVRKGPGTNYKKITTLPKNTIVSSVKINKDWLKISEKENRWCSTKYLL